MQATVKSEQLLVSKRDGAQALGACVRTIERLIAKRKLPAKRIGRRTLIPVDALRKFAQPDADQSPAKSIGIES